MIKGQLICVNNSWLVTVSLFALLSVCIVAFPQDNRARYFPRTTEYVKPLPDKENVWIFILAGQSNMAGRGVVEPRDTMPDKRILTINSANEIIVAKEPLHLLRN